VDDARLRRPDITADRGVGFADLGVQINLWMHLLGSLAAIAVVLLPGLHTWVVHRL
jgi:hypothetical protein